MEKGVIDYCSPTADMWLAGCFPKPCIAGENFSASIFELGKAMALISKPDRTSVDLKEAFEILGVLKGLIEEGEAALQVTFNLSVESLKEINKGFISPEIGD